MCSRASRFIKKKKKMKNQFVCYLHVCFCYHNLFFGALIFRGKKLKAFNFFLNLKNNLKKRENNDPFFIFLVSMMKLTPKLLLRSAHFGSFTKGVPLPISEKKSISFAVK
jgi:ribosomal protein S7